MAPRGFKTMKDNILAGAALRTRITAAVFVAALLVPAIPSAHGVARGDRRFLQPQQRAAVLIFGLFHGFGLATKLQDFALPKNGLVANIVGFNIGVEIGQILALTVVLIVLSYWRTRPGFWRHAFATNTALMAGGFLLI